MSADTFNIFAPQQEFDDQLDHIVNTALELFIENGIKRTRIEDVAQRAGLGRATVYRAIKDKNTLVKAVVSKECIRALRLVEAEVQHLDSRRKQALEGFIQVVLLASRHPLIKKLSDSEPEMILPLLTLDSGDLFDAAKLRIRHYVEIVKADGELIDNIEPDHIAELCLRLVQSFVLTPAGSFHRRSEKKLRAFVEATINRLFYR
jgi:AcrR family transcriptional regulator